MATHSSILAWRIPWTEEPGRLQSTGLDTTERLHFHFHFTYIHFLNSSINPVAKVLLFFLFRGEELKTHKKVKYFLKATQLIND